MTAHLDQNATTAAAPEVIEAMLPWLTAPSANPSARHPAGQAAADAVRAARGAVARLFGARHPREVVFTSGGTESISTALHAATATRPGRRRLVTSTVEHSATLRALEARAAAGTHDLVLIGVDRDGRLDREALFAAIDADTACVCLLVANNETGVMFELEGVGAACDAAGAAFHVDAVQAPGKVPLDVVALGCHFASLSGHKFHGPRGTGALYVREGEPFLPWFLGGPQELERRGGTENVPGIVGLGVAARLAQKKAADPAAQAALAARRDRLEATLLGALPGAWIHGAGAPRVSNTSSFGYTGWFQNETAGAGLRPGTAPDAAPDAAPSVAPDAAAVLALLAEAGVEASAGSACSAQKSGPSHVLLALGRSPAEATATLRFSLSHGTTDAELDQAAEATIEALNVLRALDSLDSPDRVLDRG